MNESVNLNNVIYQKWFRYIHHAGTHFRGVVGVIAPQSPQWSIKPKNDINNV